jgi:hypothetical protein
MKKLNDEQYDLGGRVAHHLSFFNGGRVAHHLVFSVEDVLLII